MKTYLTLLTLLALLPAAAIAGDTPATAPKLYGFCVEKADTKKRPLPQQAQLLRELGYNGGGYQLWFG